MLKKTIYFITIIFSISIYSSPCSYNLYKIKRNIILENTGDLNNIKNNLQYLVLVDPNGNGTINKSDINKTQFKQIIEELDNIYEKFSKKTITELDNIIKIWYILMTPKTNVPYTYEYLKAIYNNPNADTDKIEDAGNMFSPAMNIFTIYNETGNIVYLDYLNTNSIVNIAFEILIQKRLKNRFFTGKRTHNQKTNISINDILLKSGFTPYKDFIYLQNILNF